MTAGGLMRSISLLSGCMTGVMFPSPLPVLPVAGEAEAPRSLESPRSPRKPEWLRPRAAVSTDESLAALRDADLAVVRPPPGPPRLVNGDEDMPLTSSSMLVVLSAWEGLGRLGRRPLLPDLGPGEAEPAPPLPKGGTAPLPLLLLLALPSSAAALDGLVGGCVAFPPLAPPPTVPLVAPFGVAGLSFLVTGEDPLCEVVRPAAVLGVAPLLVAAWARRRCSLLSRLSVALSRLRRMLRWGGVVMGGERTVREMSQSRAVGHDKHGGLGQHPTHMTGSARCIVTLELAEGAMLSMCLSPYRSALAKQQQGQQVEHAGSATQWTIQGALERVCGWVGVSLRHKCRTDTLDVTLAPRQGDQCLWQWRVTVVYSTYDLR